MPDGNKSVHSIVVELHEIRSWINRENLSGGQKRKLRTGLSLVGNPPLVVMDEPTAAVDAQARQLNWKTISSLRDTTCIVTSHALEEAVAVHAVSSRPRNLFNSIPGEILRFQM